MAETNYWSRRRFDRRTAIRGGVIALAGVAGAALIGCDNGEDGGATGTATATSTTTSTATGTPNSGGVGGTPTPVPPELVRVAPGLYDAPVPPSAAEAESAINARPGGTLRMRYLEPTGMDINRALSCTVYHTMDYTNSKLIRGKVGPLAHPFLVELEPDIAESWEVSEDQTTFTFHLRQGVQTHNREPSNGREFDSEDVRLSLERYREGGSQQDIFAPVTAIEAPDAHTVTITLDQPLADFPASLASWSFLWIRELIESGERINEVAVGTGPFVQEEWSRGRRSVFRKHPGYFEDGLPYVDGIEAYVQDDTAAQRAAFIENELMDWTANDQGDAESMLDQVDDAVVWVLPVGRGANVNGWHFQLSNSLFQDERVRRAVSLAFDRAKFDEERNGNDNEHPDGPYSNAPMPWPFLYDERPSGSANGEWYRFDPAQASQLLQAVGYTADSPLTFEHASWYDRAPSSEIIIPGMIEAVPELNITFREVDNATQVSLLAERTFEDTTGIVWGPPGYSMDQWVYPFYHSNGGLNYNAVGDIELDSLLDQQRREADAEARQDIWRQIWDRIHAQVYNFWWPEPHSRRAWHNYLLNYRGHGLMGTYVCYTSQNARIIWLDEGAPGR